MSEADFEDLINGYRKQAYTRAVEDFLSAFEACEFTCDELLFALSDIFTHRGLDEIASHLDSAAQLVPLKPGNA